MVGTYTFERFSPDETVRSPCDENKIIFQIQSRSWKPRRLYSFIRSNPHTSVSSTIKVCYWCERCHLYFLRIRLCFLTQHTLIKFKLPSILTDYFYLWPEHRRIPLDYGLYSVLSPKTSWPIPDIDLVISPVSPHKLNSFKELDMGILNTWNT